MSRPVKRIGFTTSLPVEVILAAGHIPIDLNNLFINGDPGLMIQTAEHAGFPRNVCSWIKGIYTVAREASLDEVIGVTQGDCSNTQSLLALLSDCGIPVFSFAFPYEKNRAALDVEITKLEEHFGVVREETLMIKARLDRIREKLILLDEMTWKENLVSGAENHFWLVSASDFFSDPDLYEDRLQAFLDQAVARRSSKPRLRLGFLGVPPIISNLYEVISDLGGEIIYNEVQRQFAMLTLRKNIVDQYLQYTYPYSVFDRIRDIGTEFDKRQIEAVVSYTQAFCHRQIDNILLKKYLNLPFLSLEGDQPGESDPRTLLRLESFMEIHGASDSGRQKQKCEEITET